MDGSWGSPFSWLHCGRAFTTESQPGMKTGKIREGVELREAVTPGLFGSAQDVVSLSRAPYTLKTDAAWNRLTASACLE